MFGDKKRGAFRTIRCEIAENGGKKVPSLESFVSERENFVLDSLVYS